MSKKLPKWIRIVLPAALILAWFGAGALGGPYFGRIEEVSEVDLTAFLPESAEATKVNKQLSKYQSDDTLPAIVVFETKNGGITEQQQQHIEDAGKRLESLDGVKGEVSAPVMAEDEKAAFLVVPIDSEASTKEVLEEAKKTLDKSDIGNTHFKVTGPAGFAADLNTAFAGIDGILLITALAVVFVILVIVYRSAVLPVIVLLTSVLALSASILLVWWLAKAGVVQLNGQVQGILFILVIGAATDYSLLYVSRYREELYAHSSKRIATIKALKGAFEPIIASGGTVIVGLLCLLLSDLTSNKALGPVGSIGIGFAIASALTFLPAVLYALGRFSFWPVKPTASIAARVRHAQKQRRGIWTKVGRLVKNHTRPVWVLSLLVLVGAALFVPQLNAEGVSQSELILGTSEAREGQELLNKHFPDGSGSPAQIIAAQKRLPELVKKIEAVEGVDTVAVVADNSDSGFKPLGKQEAEIKDEIRTEVKKELAKERQKLDREVAKVESQAGPIVAAQVRKQAEANIPSVEELVDEAYPFADARIKVVDGKVLLQATLTNAPDSDAAKETIVKLREAVRDVDADALVGGVTATQLDTNQASIRDRTIIIPVVLLAITLILMLLLRSIIAPLLLLASTVVSLAASLGVAALLFNEVWQFPGADPSVILYAFVFLVALGIDYNIFLMTRVREESLRHGTQKGVIKGLVMTGGVITSAGIVLAATFSALVVIPILFLFQLAFIVAFGVLLDTFVVRSLLVPALIKDVGSFVWWPSKLRRKK